MTQGLTLERLAAIESLADEVLRPAARGTPAGALAQGVAEIAEEVRSLWGSVRGLTAALNSANRERDDAEERALRYGNETTRLQLEMDALRKATTLVVRAERAERERDEARRERDAEAAARVRLRKQRDVWEQRAERAEAEAARLREELSGEVLAYQASETAQTHQRERAERAERELARLREVADEARADLHEARDRVDAEGLAWAFGAAMDALAWLDGGGR